jgi:hypothetical protein
MLGGPRSTIDNRVAVNEEDVMADGLGTRFTLPKLSTPLRVLFTGYLLVVALGLLMSGVQILLTHGKADGEFGLSVDDIVYSYYGNRGDSRMEAKLSGTMKDKASSEDRAKIVKWIRGGSNEDQYEQELAPIFNANCVKCHGGISGLPPLTTYEQVIVHTEIDEGASIDSLARVSHIHLFGIAFLFVFVCGVFALAVRVPTWLKCTAIALPFAFLFIDVLSWWLTKWFPNFAYLTIAGGCGYAISSAYMILTSFYQMWVSPLRDGSAPPEVGLDP